MKNDNITRLNELIADLNSIEIMSHVEDGTLKEWLESLRLEFAMVSICLFTELSCLKEGSSEISGNNQ